MKWGLGIAAALALFVLPVQAQNTGLERLSRADQITSWKAVGRVDLGSYGFCTGTLIATDLVLTAAHCLFGPNGTPIKPTEITFRAGFADGTSVADSGVLRMAAHQDYHPTSGGKSTGDQIMVDVALIQLASPISTSVAPPFAISEPREGDEVSVVSYARGRSEALSWQRACSVLGRRPGLIAMDCDVTFGSSGAPVFDRSQGRAKIVSIISSGGSDGTRTVAFGMELPRLVGDLKLQLRSGRGVLGDDERPTVAAKRITVGGGGQASGARFVKAPGN